MPLVRNSYFPRQPFLSLLKSLLVSFLLVTRCCSVSQSCLTLWNPMDCSMPGFSVLHHLPEFAQTHVQWVSDVIQPFHDKLALLSFTWSAAVTSKCPPRLCLWLSKEQVKLFPQEFFMASNCLLNQIQILNLAFRSPWPSSSLFFQFFFFPHQFHTTYAVTKFLSVSWTRLSYSCFLPSTWMPWCPFLSKKTGYGSTAPFSWDLSQSPSRNY